MARDLIVPAASLAEILARRAAEEPDRTALLFLSDGVREGGRLSFAGLDARARGMAAWLGARIGTGERAVLAYSAGLAFPAAFLGCLYAGVIPVAAPAGGGSRGRERRHRIAADCGAAILLSDRQSNAGSAILRHDTRDIPAAADGPDPLRVRPTDTAFLQYTSGSTGTPRGVAVSHDALLEELENYRLRAGPDWQDVVYLGWLPHTHDFGLIGFHLAALYMGSPHIFMPPQAFLKQPACWMAAIAAHGASFTGAPAFGYDLAAGAAAELPDDLNLSGLSIAALGGDHIPPATLARFSAAHARHGFQNDAWLPAYGQAEAVLCITGRRGIRQQAFDRDALGAGLAQVAEQDAREPIHLISCGRPGSGQQLAIVEPTNQRRLSDGHIGEIWVTGPALATAYWNDAALTASRFGVRISADSDPKTYLRTGDLGFVHEGELFVTGRMTDRIVVRGQNHAPEQLEDSIRELHPQAGPNGIAVVQTAPSHGARLIVVQEFSRQGDLAGHCSAIVSSLVDRHGIAPDDIYLIRKGTLPRTVNGKLSRRACLDTLLGQRLKHHYRWPAAAPQTPAMTGSDATESRLLALAAELLPGPRPQPGDNLLELGLDSLMGMQMLARIKAQFGVDLPASSLAETPTLEAIAGLIRQAGQTDRGTDAVLLELSRIRTLLERQTALLEQLAADRQAAPAPPPVEPVSPLSEVQQDILLRQAIAPEAPDLFTTLMVLQCRELPAAAALQRAAEQLAGRHGALRTLVSEQQQRVLASVPVEIHSIRLDRENDLSDWLVKARARHVDPAVAPLWRLTRLEAGEQRFIVLAASHLIMDGASMPVFARDLAGALAGRIAPDAPPQMNEILAARASTMTEALRAGHRDFWAGIVGDAEPDWSPPGQPARLRDISYAAGQLNLPIDSTLRQRLVGFGAACSATLAQVLTAAYLLLLHRVSGQERLMIGLDSAGRRDSSELEAIGCLNRMVPLVFDLAGPDTPTTVQRLQRRVSQAMVTALDHQDYSLAALASDRRRMRDPGRAFQFTATLNFQRLPESLGDFTARHDLDQAAMRHAPFGLSFDIRDSGQALALTMVFNLQLFEPGWAKRLGAAYRRLLEGMCASPQADPLALPMLAEAELEQLGQWGDGGPAHPALPGIWQRITVAARAWPENSALSFEGRHICYAELQRQTERLAGQLAATGVGAGQHVGLLAERDPDFWLVCLGILARGAVYVPLDPRSPAGRLAAQARQGDVGLILHAGLDELAAEIGREADIATRAIATLAELSPEPGALNERAANDAAYVLFTSGSTGLPKAAAVSHGGMLNHLQAKIELLNLGPADRVAQVAPQGFDISIWQLLAPLLVGAGVEIMADRVTHDPSALLERTDATGASVLQVVPAVLRGMLDGISASSRKPALARLRWLISTGEALPAELCRRWISQYPRVPMVNAYGPTECSDDVTHQVAEWPPAADLVTVPIGKPIPGASLHVLNASVQPMPVGAPGELYIGGACVGPGYLNDPERDAAAFIDHPVHGRLYRSGDLVRFLRDGELEYLGRADDQVKINGVRIELGEIAAAIQNDPSVAQALVTLRPGPDARDHLVAYVVLRPGKPAMPGTLKAVARNSLPRALLPDAFVFVDRMPLTDNGKTDLAALPEPDFAIRAERPTPPETEVEKEIAGIWGDVLGLETLGMHDDFFDLGGSSLNAAQIITRLDAQFGLRIPLTQVFRTPNVHELAAYVEQARLAEA